MSYCTVAQSHYTVMVFISQHSKWIIQQYFAKQMNLQESNQYKNKQNVKFSADPPHKMWE